MARANETIFGDEEDFHVTVRPEFSSHGFEVVIWRRNHGTAGFPPIRDEQKAKDFAEYLYDTLLPEYIAERDEHKRTFDAFMAEQSRKPKPKPPKVLKNAPILTVFECLECGELIEERSDDHVYECGTCGTTASGDEGRQCDQCHKFAAKISETSCPDCGAAMDDADTVEVQRATNGTLVLVAQK